MEAQRTMTGGGEVAHRCVGCGEPVSDSRCEHCGVAVAPGGWQLKRQLAKGPHSRVFLAEKNGRQVALKEMLFALVPDAAQLEGFEREARLLAQLNHPAIPKLVESFKEGQGIHTRLYLAQDFVPGQSLLQELEHHRFDEPEVKSIARSMLETLEYLHGLSPRVIHRDIKPANIMRRADHSLALVDFGAARDLVRGATHGSTLVGTFGYMPPEQLGGTVDLSSDLYALGASLLHLLSRRPPDELLKAGMELSFDDDVNVSPAMLGWLKKLVARNPTDRFRTAKSARDALNLLEVRVAVPVQQVTTPPASTGVLLGAAVAGVVALGGLVAGVFLLRGSPNDPPPVFERVVTSQPAVVVEPPQPPEVPRVSDVPPRPMPVVSPPPIPERAVAVKKNAALAPVSTPEVQAVVKEKPLPAFTLPSGFTAPVNAQLQLSGCDGALAVLSVRAEPGGAGSLVVATQLEKAGSPCPALYVELADQRGQRDPSRATLINSAVGVKKETRFALPLNSQKVQLRFGPMSNPMKRIDVDLAQGTATAR